MNIKQISLLSLVCVASINAMSPQLASVDSINPMSPGKKLETTRNDLRNCQKSYFHWNCDKQQEAYSDARQQVIEPLREISAEGKDAAFCLAHPEQSILRRFNIPIIKQAAEQRLKNKKLDAYAASAIIEGLQKDDINYDAFDSHRYDGKSFEKYCYNVLDQGLTQHPHSTWATDTMGSNINATDKELAQAKERMMNIIKEMSQ